MLLGLLSSVGFIMGFIIIAIIASIISLENQKEGLASGIVSLAIALVLWNYHTDIWLFVSTNVSTTVYFSLGYVILGIGWSFLKWNEKVKKVFNKFKEIKDKFMKKNGEINDKNKEDFIKKLGSQFTSRSGYSISFYNTDSFNEIANKITPIGLEHKALIMSWISYWPLSLIGTLLNNPFRRFWLYVYDQVSGIYDRISKKHQNDAFAGLNTEKEK
jgi:hypothetical protein